ncbi:hypothetical protein M8C21_009368, partial [Ambrosia artemisiifolia]
GLVWGGGAENDDGVYWLKSRVWWGLRRWWSDGGAPGGLRRWWNGILTVVQRVEQLSRTTCRVRWIKVHSWLNDRDMEGGLDGAVWCGVVGVVQFADMSYVTNGYLETSLDWIPGMSNIRLRDFPTFIRTTDINDTMLNFFLNVTKALRRASAIVLNTFDALEKDSVNHLIEMIPPIFTVGPLHMMERHLQDEQVKQVRSNLWKEDVSCIHWLDTKDHGSVVFVNFGSITVMTKEQLTEFGWGLANSKKDFLWIARPDILGSNEVGMPPEFLVETKGRGMITSWCPQEQVLKHPAIGGFLTHSRWNSTLESISNGVPVLCWPFFAEQQTNCRYSCVEWGIGMEIDTNVKKEEVEAQVREIIDGTKGKIMKTKALELKKKAEEAVTIDGSSFLNFDKLVTKILSKN